MRAGLVDKRLAHAEILEEDTEVFFRESHSAGPWLNRFQIARMAKLGAGAPLSLQMTVGSTMDVGLSDFAKTPAKRAGEGVTVDESPTWVDVESNGVGFEDIVTSWIPLTPQDEVNEKARLNFEVLKRETIRASSNWSNALATAGAQQHATADQRPIANGNKGGRSGCLWSKCRGGQRI
jgi:hypothetical protein